MIETVVAVLGVLALGALGLSILGAIAAVIINAWSH